MGRAWTRENWNDIIRRINDLIQNPDPGCDDLEPLEKVSEKHIWTPDDITTVRDKLLEICPENVFEAETVKWKQKIIDEIESAIENGWCGCCEWEPAPSRELTLVMQKASWRDENAGGCTWYTGSPPVIYNYNHVYETYTLISMTPTLQIGSAAELIAAGFTSSAILNNNRWRQPACV